jgi:CheY-like chemotaxis protein
MAGRRGPARSKTPSRRAATERPPPLVLIAEDNVDHRYLYARQFHVAGFRVATALDGEMAYQRAVELRPDVVVMDLSLPRVDGWEATRRIKRDLRTRHVPVIACTAHAFGSAVERALDAGCDAYVAKPCLPEDLLHEVRSLLARVHRARRA